MDQTSINKGIDTRSEEKSFIDFITPTDRKNSSSGAAPPQDDGELFYDSRPINLGNFVHKVTDNFR